MNSKRHPFYKELSIYEDGKVFDHDLDKFINVLHDHSASTKGPIVIWNRRDGKKFTLSIWRIMYEAYIYNNVLADHWKVVPKDEFLPLGPSNLKRTKKHERDVSIYDRKKEEFEDWFGTGGGIYM